MLQVMGEPPGILLVQAVALVQAIRHPVVVVVLVLMADHMVALVVVAAAQQVPRKGRAEPALTASSLFRISRRRTRS